MTITEMNFSGVASAAKTILTIPFGMMLIATVSCSSFAGKSSATKTPDSQASREERPTYDPAARGSMPPLSPDLLGKPEKRFWLAVEYGDLAIVSWILSNHPEYLQLQDNTGGSPLGLSAARGYAEMSRLLLDKGANINAGDKDGNTPLLFAVELERESVCKLLLDRGANPNSTNTRNGQTPLHMAAIVDSIPISELLLDRGASINVIDKLDERALDIARKFKHEDLAKFLISRGAK